MGERKPYLHRGHRARVKRQILARGLDSMNDHQVAEAMLFYAIPRGDTNELAHELINRCGGTLTGVLDTRYEDLTEIDGVGEHTAHFINFLRLIAVRYLNDSYKRSAPEPATGSHELCELFVRSFLGSVREEIHAAAFAGNGKLICEQKLAEGSFGEVAVPPRRLLDFAAANNSSCIAIAHNHPSGNFLPSREDIEVTADYHMLLAAMDVDLTDHIIIGNEGAYSLRSSVTAGHIWGNTPSRRDESSKSKK